MSDKHDAVIVCPFCAGSGQTEGIVRGYLCSHCYDEGLVANDPALRIEFDQAVQMWDADRKRWMRWHIFKSTLDACFVANGIGCLVFLLLPFVGFLFYLDMTGHNVTGRPGGLGDLLFGLLVLGIVLLAISNMDHLKDKLFIEWHRGHPRPRLRHFLAKQESRDRNDTV
ncbi:MAG TPA: hypothetical protein VKF41_11800 [Bryobacteraceae bacterium]|nr:hypothetical protein [Bryobacteraceae bacterium]